MRGWKWKCGRDEEDTYMQDKLARPLNADETCKSSNAMEGCVWIQETDENSELKARVSPEFYQRADRKS